MKIAYKKLRQFYDVATKPTKHKQTNIMPTFFGKEYFQSERNSSLPG